MSTETTDAATGRRFTIDGVEVRLPVSDDWQVTKRPDGVALQLGEPAGAPVPVLGLSLLATDARSGLEEELRRASVGLTDLTVVHLGVRDTAASSWSDGAPDSRFVLATYRQGIWSMALQLGLLGAQGSRRCLLLSAICTFEELATIDPVVSEVVASATVAW